MSLHAVLLTALLPPLGNFLGGMLAELGRPSDRALDRALHAASGIVVAIVAVELLPEVRSSLGGVWIAAAFAAGGVAYVLIEVLIELVLERTVSAGGEDRSSMWMIYVAIAVDLATDGLMLGSGAAVSADLALVLAAGQVLADLPEGYAMVANFRDKGLPRTKRILLSGSLLFFCVGAAFLSYLLLRDAAAGTKMAGLTFAAGLLSVAAIEAMLEEAHDAAVDTHASVLAFVGGFALFTLVSAGLDSAVGAG